MFDDFEAFESLPKALRDMLAELLEEEELEEPPSTTASEPEPADVRFAQSKADQDTAESFFRKLLSAYKIQELRAIARRRGFPLQGTAKGEIVEQLITALRDSAGQPYLLQGLTRQELDALRLLNTVYGLRNYLTWQEAEYVWGQHRMKGKAQGLRQALDGLFEYGLLFPCRLHSSPAQHYHWLPYLSGLRLPVLKSPVKAYPEPRVRGLSRPPATPSALTALWLLVAFMEREPLRLRPSPARHPQTHLYPWLGGWDYDLDEVNRLLQQGHGYRYTYSDAAVTIPVSPYFLADDVLDRLAPWLGGDRDFAFWLVRLAMAAGLLMSPPNWDTPPTLIQERWSEWMGQAPEEQLRTLFEAWRWAMGGFIELALAVQRHPDLRLERSIRYANFQPDNLSLELAEARRFITRLLQETPVGTWLDWNQFADRVYQVDPEFLHSYWSPETWGFTVQRSKRLNPSHWRHWQRAYRPVLAAFFEGPLRWLGMVEIAHKGRDLMAFRLTEAGAWLLRGEGRPTVMALGRPGEVPVTWLDERTFQVQPTPQVADLLRLATAFTTPTDRPYTYRLTQANIEAAFARGIEPTAMARAFRELGAPLSEAIRREIEDLWSRFGRVHLYEKLTVLELADDLALREVLANTRLRNHIIHEFSPRLVVIEDSAVDELVEELVKKGYTPKLGLSEANVTVART